MARTPNLSNLSRGWLIDHVNRVLTYLGISHTELHRSIKSHADRLERGSMIWILHHWPSPDGEIPPMHAIADALGVAAMSPFRWEGDLGDDERRFCRAILDELMADEK